MRPEETNREALRQELLELCYDCHPEPEPLRERIANEPEVRALFEEMQGLAGVLEDAAQDPDAPELVPVVPPAKRGAGGAALFKRLLAAAAILAVAIPTSIWGYNEYRFDRFVRDELRLVVAGPRVVPVGAAAYYRAETWTPRGRATPADIDWHVLDQDGKKLHEGRADSEGAYVIELPPAEPKSARRPAKLVIHAKRGDRGEQRATVDLATGHDMPLVHLATDKSAYRPGELLRLRGAVLERAELGARAGSFRIRIKPPTGGPQDLPASADEKGVLATVWQVPPGAAGGRYAAEVRDVTGTFLLDRREFLVMRFQPPKLAKKVELDRETYAPGAKGAAEVTVTRQAGGVAAGAKVDGEVVLDGKTVWSGEKQLDAKGRAVFSFAIPAEVERGAARFVARVSDGGVVETEIETFIVPTGKVDVSFFPEGGALASGVKTRVYAEVRDALDRPISAEGAVVDSAGREVAKFRTGHQGRARFAIQPEAGQRYELTLSQPTSKKTFPLPEAQEDVVVMTMKSDAVAAGAPLTLELHTPAPGPWLVGAFVRGSLVGEDAVRGAGAHDISIDLPPDAAGVLRVTAFDAKMNPVAERLVRRKSARRVHVELTPAEKSLAPGGKQRIAVHAKDETGEPIRAVLGLTVTDRAVRDYAGEHRVGIEDHAWLLADVEDLEDVEDFVVAGADADRNVDLLLGTRGWRRYLWAEPEKIAALRKEDGLKAERLAVQEGWAQYPAIADRGKSAGQLRADIRAAEEWSWTAIWVVLAGAGAWLIAFCMRRGTQAVRIVVAVAGVVVVFVILSTPNFIASKVGVDRLAAVAPPESEAMTEFFDDAADGDTRRGWIFRQPLAPPTIQLGRSGALSGGELATGEGWLADRALLPRVQYDLNESLLRFDRSGRRTELKSSLGDVGLAWSGERTKLADGRVDLFGYFLPPQRDANNSAFEMPLLQGYTWPIGGKPYWKLTPPEPYAHQSTVSGDRSDFTETVYWNPSLTTDATGNAVAEFTLSDRVTTWCVTADAHGAGRIGQSEVTFDTRLPLEVSAKLPVEIAQGDALDIPVVIQTAEKAVAGVVLNFEAGEGLRLADARTARVKLDDGRARHLLKIAAALDAKPGDIELAISGKAGRFDDRIKHALRIVPRGFPHARQQSGVIEHTATLDVDVPESVLPHTFHAELKLYPSPLATLADGLQGMLREPHGCFEQTSSTNYPNVLTLQLLGELHSEFPSIARAARAKLKKGYQRLTGFECSGGGFEWYGKDPGHDVLTAYGLMQFADMSEVWDVDPKLIERTSKWLLGLRSGDGFKQSNRKGSFRYAPQETLNAYIAWSLLDTGTEPAELAAQLAAIAKRAGESDDAYELALCALALRAAKRDATAALGELAERQRENGSLEGKATITGSGGRDRVVETTALAILAWNGAEQHRAAFEKAIHFVRRQRRGSGTFGGTQATILALKAACAYARGKSSAKAGVVRVFVGDKVIRETRFEDGARDTITLPELSGALQPGRNRVRVELTGGNAFPYTLAVRYRADQPDSDPNCKLRLGTKLLTGEVAEGKTVALRVVVENKTRQPVPMPIAIIGLPAGLELSHDVLDDLVESESIAQWEQRGRELVLYWYGIPASGKLEVAVDLVARIPGRTSGPASRAYLFYDGEAKHWTKPLSVRVTADR